MNPLTSSRSHADPSVANAIPFGFSRNKGVLAASLEEGIYELWIKKSLCDPLALAEARRILGRPIKVIRIEDTEFDKALEIAYTSGSSSGVYGEVMEQIERDGVLSKMAEDLPATRDLLESGGEAPVIRLVNDLLAHALKDKASDIHIEPYESKSVIRVRVDGVMADILTFKPALHASLVSRIKIMANLDIDVKRIPQDGRVSIRLAGQPVDIRVSTLPAAYGERVVLRLLDKKEAILSLGSLGMNQDIRNTLEDMLLHPHGMLLVTGPTGSGKTTTLYSALGRMDLKRRNIMTVEDPIEYNLEGISQTQVNPAIGLTFAKALRSILRQDPDVVMIGEIRDLDTARIATQASLTGHLVLATLHTNDSISAVTRLVDLGVEPYLIASTLLGSMAQRLVRRLCLKCKKKKELSRDEMKFPHTSAREEWTSTGCDECNNIGYRGRTGVFEMMQVDEKTRALIHEGASETKLRDHIIKKNGMTVLMQDTMRLVEEGVTSYEEVIRAMES
ncbi:MAG: type II secretion system ATPase GspE [Nitrospinota bacterium]|nr:type II secretion system ATPase GspE [Nitrospinota bacterium]